MLCKHLSILYKNIKKNQIQDIQWFDFKYGIYFMNETGFFVFSRVWSTSEFLKPVEWILHFLWVLNMFL